MDSATPQLIDDICSPDPRRVSLALQAAAPLREALAPTLLARLAEAAARPADFVSSDGGPGIVFLHYLAAAWRETGAHPLLCAQLRLPGEQSYNLLGDFTTADARVVLADTWPGDLRAIESLALDERADPYSRGAAFNAATLLTVRGVLPRADTLAFFERIAAAPFDADNENDVTAATGLVSSVVDFRAWELRGTVATLFQRDLVDGGWVGQEEEVLAELEPGTSFEPDAELFPPPITDAWATVRHWAFFDELKPGRGKLSARQLRREAARPKPAPADTASWREPRPYLARPKVGRNDPCPCGSGKKYKKCHGA